jgi:hypothetical protein
MKFICLGYIDPKQWEALSDNERNAMMDECFTYDDVLRANRHFAGGEALDSPERAATLRWKNGKVSVTDGPYAETKEQLGGILILEAKDLKHAIELMSKHPGVKAGPFEIRPAVDLSQMVRESEQRRVARR